MSGGEEVEFRMKVISTLDGIIFHSLPDLPQGRWRHCMAAAQDGTLFVLGGNKVTEEGELKSGKVEKKSL